MTPQEILERLGILEVGVSTTITRMLEMKMQLTPNELKRMTIQKMADQLATAIWLNKIVTTAEESPINMTKSYKARCWVLNDDDLERLVTNLRRITRPDYDATLLEQAAYVTLPPVTGQVTQEEAEETWVKTTKRKTKKTEKKKELIDLPRRIILDAE
jgi:hypothetical protein